MFRFCFLSFLSDTRPGPNVQDLSYWLLSLDLEIIDIVKPDPDSGIFPSAFQLFTLGSLDLEFEQVYAEYSGYWT